MTPLTFGNLLKFGLDSYHNAEGRSTFLHQEREHPKLRATHTAHTIILRETFQRGPAHVGVIATTGGWTRARDGGDGFSASFLLRPSVSTTTKNKIKNKQ